MSRIIGMRHRWKDLAGKEGEEGGDFELKPTVVVVKDPGNTVTYKLETETDELDFLIGKYPTVWRPAEEGESLEGFFARHVRPEPKKDRTMVPAAYDGYRKDDVVVMALGGSGDRLAYALSKRGEEIGAGVYRIEPGELKKVRDTKGWDKERDPELLMELFATSVHLFRACGPRDRDQIKVAQALEARQSAQDERKAVAQRLRQRLIGQIFLTEEGHYPEGTIEDAYEAAEANDTILKVLKAEEARCDRDLKRIVEKLEVYRAVFEPIEGCGHALAARIIASVGDIRRFPTDAKFKAFVGVHVLGKDGKKMPSGTERTEGDSIMARRRRGQVADWAPTARQAFFLLGDQFNRRPRTPWGQKLLAYKVKFREKYPEPIEVDGKKRYTNGHIHKRAIWRTVTKFAEHLYREWRKLEAKAVEEPLKKAA